jgi:O-antigen/teichoic acid export membrane protein
MQQSFKKSYFKIYFWKGLSIILNLLSLFIVAPTLSSDPAIYGVYMLCVSLNIFLAYIDLGFINAGFKYAAEYYAKGDLKEEAKVIGFVLFILSIFLIIPFTFFLIASLKPGILLSDVNATSDKMVIASKLFLIQSLFSFNIILQKYNTIIYGVRVKNYKINQINIIANSIKLASIFYFFKKDSYDIVGYYLFWKSVETIAIITNTYLSKNLSNYSFFYALRYLRFSKTVFDKTKRLAIVSFVGSLFWIIYNELDSIVITKFFGVETFAFFAVAITFVKFIRSLFAVVFMPFNARFNHFLGQNRPGELKEYFFKLLNTIFPVIFLLITTILFLRKPLILSWVGSNYFISIEILFYFMLSMIFNPIKNLSTSLSNALEKIKLLYIVNFVLMISYWLSILLLVKSFSYLSFAYAKFISAFLSNIIFLFVISYQFKVKPFTVILDLIKPVILPTITIFLLSLLVNENLVFFKNSSKLLLVLFIAATIYSISLAILYFSSTPFRRQIRLLFENIKSKNS